MGQGGKGFRRQSRIDAPRALLPALNHLEQARGTHPAADAHGHHDVLCAPAPAFYERVTREARAGSPVRMANRDGSAVDVQPVVGDAQTIAAIDHLNGESL